jgi:hypothetical protein
LSSILELNIGILFKFYYSYKYVDALILIILTDFPKNSLLLKHSKINIKIYTKGARIFLIHHHVQAGSGAHSNSYLGVLGALSPRLRMRGANVHYPAHLHGVALN